MDFALGEEHRLFQQTVRDFARREIAPRARKVDHTGAFPWDNVRGMAELGLLGLPFPERWGGAGGDTTMYAIAVEEIARACGSTALTLAAHVSLGAYPLYLFGSDEQKERFLVPLARGDGLGAFGLTEPGAGSDVARLRTTARRDGRSFVLNGSKTFITSGRIARTLVVFALTAPELGSKGISSFVVEAGTPGFSTGADLLKMGLKGSVTSELFFEDCRLPAENLLGAENDGMRQALQILDGGRISIGAMALGLGQAAYDAALAYAGERRQFGQPLRDFEAIQFKLADMATGLEAARLLVYQAAWLKDAGRPFTREAAMAKLFASEVAERACHQSIQIHGGYGYLQEYDVERIYRDVRLCEIGEGTSEIQRLVIARHLQARQS